MAFHRRSKGASGATKFLNGPASFSCHFHGVDHHKPSEIMFVGVNVH